MKWKISGIYIASLTGLLLSVILVQYVLLFYWFSPDHASTNPTSPEKFALEFENHIIIEHGKPQVSSEGKRLLKENNAWLQILDMNGYEAGQVDKPAFARMHYSPSDLIRMYKYTIEGYTVFISKAERDSYPWSYMIGFPETRVARYTVHFNRQDFSQFLSGGFVVFILVALLCGLLFAYLYAKIMARPIWKIIEGLTQLAKGDYTKRYQVRGIYKEAYQSLDDLSKSLQSIQIERTKLDQMREEWITNLSHDLKTPLSSIQGYSEVLADKDYEIGSAERERYASIILGKSKYMEKLLEDLQLTYQLKNEILTLVKREVNVAAFLREIIIQIINNPTYGDRTIRYLPQAEYLFLHIDEKWMERALTNLLMNAVVHNPADTIITVTARRLSSATQITIQDNGKGIPEQEVERLFERYFRGTSTESHHGSGLGMAIARQIIHAHGGKIEVNSKPGKGTEIILTFET